MRRLIASLLLLLLAACQTLPPPSPLPALQLPPGAFGAELQLAQRLTVTDVPDLPDGPVTERQLDTLLQVDAQQLQLVGLAMGQRVLTLRWDGKDMQVQRHPLLPGAVDAARVLRDVALVFAPLPALQAALPAGWTLDEADGTRVLREAGQLRLSVRYLDGTARVEIDNRAEH